MSYADQSSSLIGTGGQRQHARHCRCWQVCSVIRARNDDTATGVELNGDECLS